MLKRCVRKVFWEIKLVTISYSNFFTMKVVHLLLKCGRDKLKTCACFLSLQFNTVNGLVRSHTLRNSLLHNYLDVSYFFICFYLFPDGSYNSLCKLPEEVDENSKKHQSEFRVSRIWSRDAIIHPLHWCQSKLRVWLLAKSISCQEFHCDTHSTFR